VSRGAFDRDAGDGPKLAIGFVVSAVSGVQVERLGDDGHVLRSFDGSANIGLEWTLGACSGSGRQHVSNGPSSQLSAAAAPVPRRSRGQWAGSGAGPAGRRLVRALASPEG
jgi:hypothetical protein